MKLLGNVYENQLEIINNVNLCQIKGTLVEKYQNLFM